MDVNRHTQVVIELPEAFGRSRLGVGHVDGQHASGLQRFEERAKESPDVRHVLDTMRTPDMSVAGCSPFKRLDRPLIDPDPGLPPGFCRGRVDLYSLCGPADILRKSHGSAGAGTIIEKRTIRPKMGCVEMKRPGLQEVAQGGQHRIRGDFEMLIPARILEVMQFQPNPTVTESTRGEIGRGLLKGIVGSRIELQQILLFGQGILKQVPALTAAIYGPPPRIAIVVIAGLTPQCCGLRTDRATMHRQASADNGAPDAASVALMTTTPVPAARPRHYRPHPELDVGIGPTPRAPEPPD